MRIRRISMVPAVLALTVALTACGGDQTGPETRDAAASKALQLLTADDVNHYPESSPAHTVLVWWRNMQFRNPKGALEGFTPEIRKQVAPGFSELVFRDFGPWLQNARPYVDDSAVVGVGATVYLDVKMKSVVGPKIIRQTKEQVAFPLQKIDGEWLIADPTFYLQNAARLRQARLAAEKQSKRPT